MYFLVFFEVFFIVVILQEILEDSLLDTKVKVGDYQCGYDDFDFDEIEEGCDPESDHLN